MLNRGILIALGGAPLLLLLVACSSGGDKKSSTPTPRSGGQPAAQATATSPSGAGARAFDTSTVKSFRAKVEIEAAGSKQEMTVEVVQPDKYHMTLSIAGYTAQIIAVGSTTYYNFTGTWTSQSLPGVTMPFDVKDVYRSANDLQAATGTRGSTATVSGKTCQLYTYTISSGTYEVCVADNLPIRIVSQSAGTKTTITFSDYNANIEIKAPI